MTWGLDRRLSGRASGGAVALVLVRIGGYALLATTSLVVARSLRPAGYGLIATATSVSGIVLVLGLVGIDQLFLRKVLAHAALVRHGLAVSAVSLGLVGVAATAWPHLSYGTRWLVVLSGAGSAVAMTTQVWLLMPQRDQQYRTRARRELVLRVLSAVSVAIVAVATRAPIAVGLTILVASAIPAAAVLVSYRPSDSVSSSLTLSRALGKGLPYALSGALYSLYFSVDIALVGTILGSTRAGYYSIASGFLTAAATLPIVMNNDVLRTRLYRERESPQDAPVGATAGHFLSLTLGAAVVVLVVLLTAGHPITRLLYGRAYLSNVAPLVSILALAVPPHYFNSWAGNVLVGRDEVRAVLTVQSLLTTLNVAANATLLTTYGVRAAAWITVVTESVGSATYLVMMVARRHRQSPAAC